MIYCRKKYSETVEAEITAMMPLQRACGAESRVKNRLSNGPLRAQSNVLFTVQSILRRVGIRQLSGICWYPAKGTAVVAVNQGGTADKCNYSSLTELLYNSVRGVFVCAHKSSSDRIQRSFLILSEVFL